MFSNEAGLRFLVSLATSLWVQHCGLDYDIPMPLASIAIKKVHGSQRMNPSDFDDPLKVQ